MSGLEKFQDNPAWRQKLRNHLLMDRPPRTKTQPQLESMERRHSLGIVLDFPALIKARKEELEQQKQREKIAASAVDLDIKNESLIKEDMQQQAGDDSFAAFERMCDKTASDPDSTLFQYLHSDDKDQVLAMVKRGSSSYSDKSGDMETEALQRILADVGNKDQLYNESPVKSPDCTQLEHIEAPSRFWDDSLMTGSHETVYHPSAQTSPVKMVGLLRPSTILEGNEAELTGLQSDDSSSQSSSFLTARTLKTEKGDETTGSGSSCYETAADNSGASSSKEPTALSVDDLFYAAIAKAKPHGISKGEQEELLIDLQETLMDLAVTDAADSTIIEVSSSSEDEEEDSKANHFKTEIKEEEFSLKNSDTEEDKENNSARLNDTMEEMEYMIRKAEEYMFAKQTAPTPSVAAEDEVVHLHQKPTKQNTFVLTPTKGSPASRQPMSSKNSHQEFRMDMPKDKFFKEPSGIPTRLHPKNHKDNFAHIVSPIRAYTQKSGTAPLMSMFREKPTKASHIEIEEDSFFHQIKRGPTSTDSSNPSKISKEWFNLGAPLLPKKAYISSEVKQVVDERTPLPMPSVPKIQKYLNSAAEPTVVRHDGKMKMPTGSSSSSSGAQKASHIPRRPNQSLADLSLASGDISLYTLKDAQKF